MQHDAVDLEGFQHKKQNIEADFDGIKRKKFDAIQINILSLQK